MNLHGDKTMGWLGPALTIGSSLISGNAQKKAADGSIDWIKNVYGDSKTNLNPFIQGGQQGLQSLLSNNYTQSPGYQYLKDEMTGAVDDRAANAGSYFSGGTNLDVARHVNGLAAQDYNNWWDNQMGLAQLGAQSASNLGGIGTSSLGSMNQALGNKADATSGMASGVLNGIGQLFGPTSGSSYGNFGIPGPVSPYSNTGWGS